MRLTATLAACAAIATFGIAVVPSGASASSAPSAQLSAEWGEGEYRYGNAVRQALDFYPATDTVTGPRPLIVFVHGGAWQFGDRRLDSRSGKARHYPELGYHLASVGYRLVPDVTIEQQAADIAASLRYLVDNANAFGIDSGHIVLMGHSAGAHLAALVGTDPTYLEGVGLSLADIDGVIALDGAAYDATQRDLDMGILGMFLYGAPFGSDPVRQAALSPVHHAHAPNVDDWLLLHVQRRDAIAQADALDGALRAGGSSVAMAGVAGRGLQGHAEINNRLGDADYPATEIVDDWLGALFAR